MSVKNKPIESFGGTSIFIQDEIDLAAENVVGTKRYYKFHDWKSFAVFIDANGATSGTVAIQQSMDDGGESFALSTPGSIDLAAAKFASGSIQGSYLVLNFSGTTIPSTGKLFIKVLGKRN